MEKNFKRYKYADCIEYVLYMKEKYKNAFEAFKREDINTFKNCYKEIKNELKEDSTSTVLRRNYNTIVSRWLPIDEAYDELYEPVNSKNTIVMYSNLLSSWDDLSFYIEGVRSSDI